MHEEVAAHHDENAFNTEAVYEFSYGSDRSVRILEIGWVAHDPGLAPARYVLLGDGTLQSFGGDDRSADAQPRSELVLSASETLQIIDDIVQSGLVEFDSDVLRDRFDGRVPQFVDAAGLTIHITLDSYSGPYKSMSERFTHTTGAILPSYLIEKLKQRKAAGLADRDAELPEVEALLECYERLRELVESG